MLVRNVPLTVFKFTAVDYKDCLEQHDRDRPQFIKIFVNKNYFSNK